MPRFLSPKTHPFPFLLYLEWLLLAIVVVSETASLGFYNLPRSPLLSLFCLALFTLMGLRLPWSKPARITYTGVELGLILLVSFPGGIPLFALLYIVLVIRNCVLFSHQEDSKSLVFGITGIAFGLCVFTQLYRFRRFSLPDGRAEPASYLWLSAPLLVGLVILFLHLLVGAMLAERKSSEKLAATNIKLREYALQIEQLAIAQERNRIAREIHDSLGHSLTVFNLHLEAAIRLMSSDPAEAKDLLMEAKQLSAIALQEVRQSVSALRSDPLQGRSLATVIQLLTDDFQRSTGIAPLCKIDLNQPLSDATQLAVYRIVQEALTNSCNYAEATQIDIHLETNLDLKLMIRDNGKGFDIHQAMTGFGLRGMEERTLAQSGKFEVISTPGNGCQIMAWFPLCNADKLSINNTQLAQPTS
jgi:signal transduction histidine kinase